MTCKVSERGKPPQIQVCSFPADLGLGEGSLHLALIGHLETPSQSCLGILKLEPLLLKSLVKLPLWLSFQPWS